MNLTKKLLTPFQVIKMKKKTHAKTLPIDVLVSYNGYNSELDATIERIVKKAGGKLCGSRIGMGRDLHYSVKTGKIAINITKKLRALKKKLKISVTQVTRDAFIDDLAEAIADSVDEDELRMEYKENQLIALAKLPDKELVFAAKKHKIEIPK